MKIKCKKWKDTMLLEGPYIKTVQWLANMPFDRDGLHATGKEQFDFRTGQWWDQFDGPYGIELKR